MGLKIETKKIKKLPRVLAENSFLTFLAFLVIAVILGVLIFYKYSILIKREGPEITEKPLKFEKRVYQEILKTWREREKEFEEADLKEYPNPFK